MVVRDFAREVDEGLGHTPRGNKHSATFVVLPNQHVKWRAATTFLFGSD